MLQVARLIDPKNKRCLGYINNYRDTFLIHMVHRIHVLKRREIGEEYSLVYEFTAEAWRAEAFIMSGKLDSGHALIRDISELNENSRHLPY